MYIGCFHALHNIGRPSKISHKNLASTPDVKRIKTPDVFCITLHEVKIFFKVREVENIFKSYSFLYMLIGKVDIVVHIFQSFLFDGSHGTERSKKKGF